MSAVVAGSLPKHTHFQRLLLWLYLYQKNKKTAVETDVAGNVDIEEKSFQAGTLACFPILFIRAIICARPPNSIPSARNPPKLHASPPLMHKLN